MAAAARLSALLMASLVVVLVACELPVNPRTPTRSTPISIATPDPMVTPSPTLPTTETGTRTAIPLEEQEARTRKRYVGEGPLAPAVIESLVIALTNEERRKRGLPQLHHDPAISDIARAHSENMMKKGLGTVLDGQGPTDRALAAGYDCREYTKDGSGKYTYGFSEDVAEYPRVKSWSTLGGVIVKIDFDENEIEVAQGIVRLWTEDVEDKRDEARGIFDEGSRRIGVGVAIQESREGRYTFETVYATQNLSSCAWPISTGPSLVPVASGLTPAPASVSTLGPDPTSTAIPPAFTPAVTSTPTAIPPGMPTPTPVPTTRPMSIPTLNPDPTQRHVGEKRLMLHLINEAREEAGLEPLVMGDNPAAQLHAESALAHCFSGHWGIDGMKPYMRYSLHGGYQSNGENVSGSDFCIERHQRYRAIQSVEEEVREAMQGLLNSSDHRRQILEPSYRKVNVGLAWDEYNFKVVQHFEGDYMEYAELPTIERGVLKMTGAAKNGVALRDGDELHIQIRFDPPAHPLTRGQLSRTYCYPGGLLVASLREPMTGDLIYFRDEVARKVEVSSCPDPYDVPTDTLAPSSPLEASQFWQEAYDASQRPMRGERITVSKITASEWSVSDQVFSVVADLGSLLSEHGEGVYTFVVWAPLDGESSIISEYSVFVHDPPTRLVGPSADSRTAGQRLTRVRQQMLEVINVRRREAGLEPLSLGDNPAAQLHAESALANCFSGHWGLDGSKPYMRYSLAGGYQANIHYTQGSDYCVTEEDGYRAKDAIQRWMSDLALDPHHKKTSIGFAWDEYNTHVVMYFEGDYVEYDELPNIDGDGVLKLAGRMKNGATAIMEGTDWDMGVAVYHDPPLRPLTLGQVLRAYCTDNGLKVASLRLNPPPSAGWHYTEHEYEWEYKSCPDPHDAFPVDAPLPQSYAEARRLQQEAYDASQNRDVQMVVVPWINARVWEIQRGAFRVEADIKRAVDANGAGVYSVVIWGEVDGETAVVSVHSVFLD